MLKFELSTELIEQRQRDVKAELDAVAVAEGVRARARYILERLEASPDSLTLEVVVDRYLYAMHGLKMEIDYRIYPHKVQKQLRDQIEAILKLFGDLRRSAFSFLEADYRRFCSQLAFRQGKWLNSRWLLEEANYFSGKGKNDKERLQQDQLGRAIRLHREGRLDEALATYKDFIAQSEDPAKVLQSKIHILRIYRLLDRHHDFKDLHDELMLACDSHYRSELVWEATVYRCYKSNSLNELFRLHRKEQWSESYFVDLCLRVYAFPSTKFIEKLPAVSNKRESGGFDHRLLGVEFEAALMLEMLYSNTIPMGQRIHDLGEFLEKLPQMPTFELQMLFLCAAIRWARRRRLEGFAEILTQDYERLCRNWQPPEQLVLASDVDGAA